jgi:hypothetical protein
MNRENYIKNADAFLSEGSLLEQYDNGKIKAIVEEAIEAFWTKVVEIVPEAKTGDIDPMAAHKMDNFLQEVVKNWIENNVY